jgi:hypothetical protein
MERAVYSIPVYALRFAAHCRSRLRFAELQQTDVTRAPVGSAKVWIRLSRTHERFAPDCTALRLSRSRS